MKRIIFFLFFSINVYGQLSFSTFPKIGFGDMFYVANAPFYWHEHYAPTPDLYNLYKAKYFYYPELRDLGLNHVVTFGGAWNPGYTIDKIPLLPAYNPTLKVIDMYFVSRLSRYDAGNPKFTGYVYASGQGNAQEFEYYHVGGNKANFEFSGGYGFGVLGNPGQTSAWITYPPVTGTSDVDQSKGVFLATTASHSAGNLMEAELPEYHQARKPPVIEIGDSVKYCLVLNCRIDGYTNSSDTNTVAFVVIKETPFPTPPPPKKWEKNQLYFVPQTHTASTPLITDTTFAIRIKDFGGNDYINWKSPYFFKRNGKEKNLKIVVYWRDIKNMYIDHFYIYDNFYDKLLLASDTTTTHNAIKTEMQNSFGSVVTNSLYSHFYMDEPWPNSYRAVNKMSTLANAKFSVNKYVNGAVGDYANHMLQYGNSQGRLPYIMIDKYPFWYWYDTATTANDSSVQHALDSLIDATRTENSSSGLKHSIQMAHNYTSSSSDDVPLVCAIQVQAEKRIVNGTIPDVNNGYYMRFRAPTPNEIKVQGFLSICYGAKGLAYYTVCTQTESNTDDPNTDLLSTYGLFDQSGHAYNDQYFSNGLVQDPNSDQVPNARYYAVKELNAAIDKIGSELLTLNWQGAKSWHNSRASDGWTGIVSDVSTNVTGETKYIETGHFNNASSVNYIIVVNRRTLSTESRNITVNLSLPSGSYEILDIATGKIWIVAYDGYFVDTFSPGEGKLYKIGPATWSGTKNIVNVVTIQAGATLNVNAGTTLKFATATGITSNGVLNINGSSSSRVLLTTPSDSGTYGSWDSIILDGNGASSSSVNYVNMRFGTELKVQNGYPSVNISNSMFYQNINGINLYNAFECQIINNTISDPRDHGIIVNDCYAIYCYENVVEKTDHSGAGILYTGGSDGEVWRNTINGYNWGFGSSWGASPILGSGNNNSQNNWIRDNLYGFRIYNDSYPTIGFFGDGYYYGNSVYDNVFKEAFVHTCPDEVIWAHNVYWGGEPDPSMFDTSGIKLFLCDYSLLVNPWDGYDLMTSGSGDNKYSAITSLNKSLQSTTLYNYTTGIKLKQEGKYSEAKELFISMLKQDHNYSPAYSQLYVLYMKSKDESISEYFHSLSADIPFTAKDILSRLYVFEGNIDDAVKLNETIIENSKNNQERFKALLNKFYIALYHQGNYKTASEILTSLEDAGEEYSMELSLAEHSLNSCENISTDLQKSSKKMQAKNVTIIPSVFVVEQNYPNPFNPTTTITFSIPEANNVRLAVYDYLGREVSILIDGLTSAGTHDIQFDASKLSSGMYFYKIISGKNVATKKMLLLK